MQVHGLDAWRALEDDARRLISTRTELFFSREPGRLSDLALETAGVRVDLSKNKVDQGVLANLAALAEQRRLGSAIEALFTGEPVNGTERRPALHTLLRTPATARTAPALSERLAEVLAVKERVTGLGEKLRHGKVCGHTGAVIRDVVNIGIGGSHLGPQVVCEALRCEATGGIGVHFVSNVDDGDIESVLARLEPATTLFVVASKSFTTAETLLNANTARQWIQHGLDDPRATRAHFAAVTSQPERAREFGVDGELIYPMWDWVGGRYSLWSAIGITIVAAVGGDGFEQLLSGAHAMDEHFRSAPLLRNIPAMLGLVGIWNNNFQAHDNLAVIPYDERLQRLPEYLQQLEMESNGKRVTHDGADVVCDTSPVLWGGVGTNVQHAFFQQLHQGTRKTAIDFIVAMTNPYANRTHQDMLVANCFAQAEGLMRGRDGAEPENAEPTEEARRLAPHRACPGDRPSTMITVDTLNPATMGALLAMYEHKTYTQAVIWGINPFDQWGVELGKRLADSILRGFAGKADGPHDPSTAALIARYMRSRSGE